MPKMKTKSGAKKRLRVTGSGKIKHKKQGLRHILTKKGPKRKRQLGKHGILSAADTPRMKRLLNG
jgi:large subunit ribosomal protein L35